MTMDWTRMLVEQLTFAWDVHLRPRLAGLTDDEYFWEPAPDCWNLRRHADGGLRPDWESPEPSPPPITTIAWRMTHLSVECLESRALAVFGGEGPDQWAPGKRIIEAGELPSNADDAISYLERAYAAWLEGIAELDEAALCAPLGSIGGPPFVEAPMAALILHISRETIHHGAEICLLRDLCRAAYTHSPS